MATKNYINPTQESGNGIFLRQIKGSVAMLNLFKFKQIADYSDTPGLTQETETTGLLAIFGGRGYN